MRQAKGNWI